MHKPATVTARIVNLRELYLKSPVATEQRPQYYADSRWQSLYFLEGWYKFRNMDTTILRRAYAEAHIFDCSKPIINDYELIVGQLDFLPYTEEEQARFDKLNEMFIMSPHISPRGRKDHMCLNYEKLLKLGVSGLIREIEAKMSHLVFDDPARIAENIEKEEFYEGCLVELKALLGLAVRYSSHAAKLAETTDKKRAEELMEISEILRRVPANPAQTFREALQSIHFYTYNLFGLYPAGRPDQYLLSFYKSDMETGRLTKDRAQELIDNFCMLYSTYIFSHLATSLMIGGKDKNGNQVENDLTYMFLTSIEHTKMADPSVGLCVNENTSEEILRYAINIISQGYTHPSLWNDNAITESFAKYGFDKEDAHNYINTTCGEITICGKSNMWTTCPYHSLVEPLIKTIKSEHVFNNLDDIIDAFSDILKEQIIAGNKLMNRLQMERARYGAEQLLASCLIDDCITKGRSVGQSGAVYNQILPTFVGLANVVDSLAAIEDIVFKNKMFSLKEFLKILNSNYEGNEWLRQYIINKVPHYGNNNDFCDNIAVKISKIVEDSCKGIYTYRGTFIIPGMFSYNTHSSIGKSTQATPDGRQKGDSLSDGIGPVQGRDTNGPTSCILSVTKWEQPVFLGGTIYNLKIGKSLMTEHSIENIITLVKTYFTRGGVQIQINVIDAEVLRKAMEHPQQYADLLVRIGGYSDYFVKLNSHMQQEIISRTEQEVR